MNETITTLKREIKRYEYRLTKADVRRDLGEQVNEKLVRENRATLRRLRAALKVVS